MFALFCKKNYLLNFGLPEFWDFSRSGFDAGSCSQRMEGGHREPKFSPEFGCFVVLKVFRISTFFTLCTYHGEAHVYSVCVLDNAIHTGWTQSQFPVRPWGGGLPVMLVKHSL